MKNLKQTNKFQILFKTVGMDQPRLTYQKSRTVDGHVALLAQFMPTFEAQQPQDSVHQIKYTDDPDDIKEVQMDREFESSLGGD